MHVLAEKLPFYFYQSPAVQQGEEIVFALVITRHILRSTACRYLHSLLICSQSYNS